MNLCSFLSVFVSSVDQVLPVFLEIGILEGVFMFVKSVIPLAFILLS